jgi:hypothetical protein
MAKKRKSSEAKEAHKPIRNLHPDAKHSGEYQDRLNNPPTQTLSTSTEHMNRSADTAGPQMWGDPSNMDMGLNPSNVTGL